MSKAISSSLDTSLTYDVIVIGAGIHGASVACEAASRGLNTLVVQSGHIGESASASPVDLVGGGIQNLENFQFSELLSNMDELALLHRKAPHLVRPISTYILNSPEVRSTRKVHIGAKLYQRLQRNKLKFENNLDDPNFINDFLESELVSPPILEYAANQTRLIIALLQNFTELGGTLASHHRLVKGERKNAIWQLSVDDLNQDKTIELNGKILINCAGCQAKSLLKNVLGVCSRGHSTEFIAGQLFINRDQHWHSAAMLQHPNKLLISAQSFDDTHLSIGPIVAHDESEAAKAQAIDEFLDLWNSKVQNKLSKEDIIHCRWATRPLAEDPSTNQAAHFNEAFLDLNNPGRCAPLLNVFGLNLAKHRLVAEQALDILEPFTRAKKATGYFDQVLPGGEFSDESLQNSLAQIKGHYNFLDKTIIERLLFTYGTNTLSILGDAKSLTDLGQDFGHGLYQAEVDYLTSYEWASTAEDILWRRTYLGLIFDNRKVSDLEKYLSGKAL